MAISPRVTAIARGMREPANGLTHLAGVLLSLAALVALVGIGLRRGSATVLIALIVFGLSQVPSTPRAPSTIPSPSRRGRTPGCCASTA